MACHSGASPAGMLGLAEDDVHAQLLGTSYVMEKLTDEMPEAGEQMPPTAAIDDARIELVRSWIDGGAPAE